MSLTDPRNFEQAVVGMLRILGCEAPVIAPVHHLSVDLGMDSTELIELATIVRDQLGLRIKPDLRQMETVSDLAAELARLVESDRRA
jgi:acyl carrier protein